MRRHGQLDKVEDDRGTLKEALMNDLTSKKKKRARAAEKAEKAEIERSENDEELRRITGRRG